MGKVKPYTIKRSKQLKIFSDFYHIAYQLKNKKDVINFFTTLLSSSENLMLVRRVQIAQLLLSDKSNVEIKKKLKVGSDNIVNVSKWLYDDRNITFKEQIMKNLENEIDE